MIKDLRIWRRMSQRQQHQRFFNQRFLGFPPREPGLPSIWNWSRIEAGSSRLALTRSVMILGKICKIIFPWTYIAYIQERSFERGNPSYQCRDRKICLQTQKVQCKENLCEKHSSRSRLLYQGGIRLMSGGEWGGYEWIFKTIYLIYSVIFSTIFRHLEANNCRNSELEENFGWVRQKICWVR